ncbi:MAG TPA: hypothetical protein VF807_16125 [Ktedonobacterales bacterium]
MLISWWRRCLPPALTALLLALTACGSTRPTIQKPLPLQVMAASLALTPDHYSGSCGGTQQISLAGTIQANANNGGGTVHYVWHLADATGEGDATLSAGQTEVVVRETLSYAVRPDAYPYIMASFRVASPNAMQATDARFIIACTVPFAISAVTVTTQPWTGGCGQQTFGWAALIEAPPNNAGGTVHYSWYVPNAPGSSGNLTFAPGQTTQVVTIARTFFVSPGGAPPATPGTIPVVSPGDVYARLSVSGPNSMDDYAAPSISC